MTHLIDIVNDSDNTRNRLSARLKSTNDSLNWTLAKKKMLLGLSVLIVLACGGHYYLTKTLYLELYVGAGLTIVLAWVLYAMRSRYLEWMKSSLENRMKSTTMETETEVKQILSILGKGLESKLKAAYESKIDESWAK